MALEVYVVTLKVSWRNLLTKLRSIRYQRCGSVVGIAVELTMMMIEIQFVTHHNVTLQHFLRLVMTLTLTYFHL